MSRASFARPMSDRCLELLLGGLRSPQRLRIHPRDIAEKTRRARAPGEYHTKALEELGEAERLLRCVDARHRFARLAHLVEPQTDFDELDPQPLAVQALLEITMNLRVAQLRADFRSTPKVLQLQLDLIHAPP
jgi:hypothetical protein